MTTYRVRISDPFLLSHRLRRLGTDWQTVSENALRGAMLVTGYLDAVWQRTPKSDRARYASRYKGVGLKVKQRGREGDPSSWSVELQNGWDRRVMSGAETTRERDRREAAIQRLNEYGMERLANSLIPGGNPDHNTLRVRHSSRTVSLVLASSIGYAARMHEALKPAEGDYWTPGKDRGWSASGTGNRFVEKPLEDYQDRIVEEFASQIDSELARRGLL